MRAGDMSPDAEVILKRESCLYVDLECCDCGKMVALSNMVHNGKHYYCNGCAVKTERGELK